MFDESRPIYRQIADQIRQEIIAGDLQEEDQVMSTTQYAATFLINPATAAKAFTELVDEGTIHKKRGVGMFVSPGARDRLLSERRERFFDESFAPVIEEARRIGIPLARLIEYVNSVQDAAEEGEK